MLPGRPQLFIHVEKLKATQNAAEIFMAINKWCMCAGQVHV